MPIISFRIEVCEETYNTFDKNDVLEAVDSGICFVVNGHPYTRVSLPFGEIAENFSILKNVVEEEGISDIEEDTRTQNNVLREAKRVVMPFYTLVDWLWKVAIYPAFYKKTNMVYWRVRRFYAAKHPEIIKLRDELNKLSRNGVSVAEIIERYGDQMLITS